MKRLIPLLTAAGLAASVLGGCDSTVGLDPTRPSFTDLLAPGVCPVADNLSEVDISVLMLAGRDGVLPDDVLLGESRPVSELLEADGFEFRQAATGADFPAKQAWAEGVQNSSRTGVDLLPIGFDFLWSGGEDRRGDDKLIVFLMDQSGSLIGRDPFDPEAIPNTALASDRTDSRLIFFRQLLVDIERNRPDDWVSLVTFNKTFNSISQQPEWATPTQNRDIIRDALLEELGDADNKDGQTPLADALDDVLRRIINLESNKDLNPVVVLFTDGVENGDSSSASFDSVLRKYADQKVPVIVLDLQPRRPEFRGADPDLAKLGCESGGEYLFLRDADEFTKNANLPAIVRNRIEGIWRLRTQTSMGPTMTFPNDTYLLSSELTVTLGEGTDTKSESTALVLSRDNNDITLSDTRLRLFK